jgi:hypothetical protein
MIGKLYLEFVDQPLGGMTFSYYIYNNNTPLQYDNGIIGVDKMFVTASNVKKSIGRIALTDDDLAVDDVTFNPDDIGIQYGDVYDIAGASGSVYYVGGDFTYYNENYSKAIVKISSTGSTIFNNNFFSGGSGGGIRTLGIKPSNQYIYAGGDFTMVQGYTSPRIVRMKTDGTYDPTFYVGSGFGASVNKIKVLSDGKIIVGGAHTTYNGIATTRLTKLNENGSMAGNVLAPGSGFNYNLQYGFQLGDVYEIEVDPSDDSILVGGSFGKFNLQNVNGLVKLNSSGFRVGTFNPTASGFPAGSSIYAIAVDGSNYYVGGKFESYNDEDRKCFVKMDSYGVIQNDLILDFNGVVKDIKVDSSGNIIVVGQFTTVNGLPVGRAAKFDSSGNLISSVDDTNFTNAVNVATPLTTGSGYLLGGSFTNILTTNATQEGIPIGTTMADTQQNTYDNLTTYNTSPDVHYKIIGDTIEVTYLTSQEDVITYDDIVDIPSYLNIYYLTENVGTISLISRPMPLAPVYNPLKFKFFSTNYTKDNFKYNVIVTKYKTGEVITKQTPKPLINGEGEVDLSKILSSFTSVDFNNDLNYISGEAPNSYINYSVSIGEEYKAEWIYDTYEAYGEGVVYPNNIMLYQDNIIKPHTFQIGDQINIVTTTASQTDRNINGLHTVVAVPNLSSIVIDVLDLDNVGTINQYGTVIYADERNVAYENIYSLDNLVAFNGALPWKTLKDYDSNNYIVQDTGLTFSFPNVNLLTNIPDNFYITPTQNLFINYAAYIPYENVDTNLIYFAAFDTEGQPYALGSLTVASQSTNRTIEVRQFNVSPEMLGLLSEFGTLNYFLSIGGGFSPSTKFYTLHMDNRCRIEDYEICFMDRLGSIASFSFQLRSKEKITITKDTYKQRFDIEMDTDGYYYDNTKGGSVTIGVDVVKEYELNTNWMTDEMSVYFQEFMISPYTWIKIEGNYYSCVVQDKDLEITRQKNQTLIKKTITVRLSNDDIINI